MIYVFSIIVIKTTTIFPINFLISLGVHYVRNRALWYAQWQQKQQQIQVILLGIHRVQNYRWEKYNYVPKNMMNFASIKQCFLFLLSDHKPDKRWKSPEWKESFLLMTKSQVSLILSPFSFNYCVVMCVSHIDTVLFLYTWSFQYALRKVPLMTAKTKCLHWLNSK